VSQELGWPKKWDVLVNAKPEKVRVSGDEAINPARDGRGQKVVVVRVILDHRGRFGRFDQHRELLEGIINLYELVVRQSMHAAMAGIVEYAIVLTQNHRRHDQLEGARFPKIDDARHPTVRGQVATNDGVGIEDNAHA